MSEPRTLPVLLAVLFMLTATPLQAGPRWVTELGQAQARPGAPTDANCGDPDSESASFLSCRRPLDVDAEQGQTWALGFDTPLTDGGKSSGQWWAGFRLGHYPAATVEARLPHPDQADDQLHARVSAAYALAQLRREWTPDGGSLRPYIAGGVGVARTSVRDFRRDDDTARQQAPDGNDSGYLLRFEAGIIWQLGERLHLGLAVRHDALDAWATPAGTGWVEGAGGRREQDFAATRGRLGYHSALISLSWPFGVGRGDIGK